jgi:hypothetical protein
MAHPRPLDGNSSLLVPAGDVENEEVWRDLRPDITSPEAAVGKERLLLRRNGPKKKERLVTSRKRR